MPDSGIGFWWAPLRAHEPVTRTGRRDRTLPAYYRDAGAVGAGRRTVVPNRAAKRANARRR